jgi:hypothetical protein
MLLGFSLLTRLIFPSSLFFYASLLFCSFSLNTTLALSLFSENAQTLIFLGLLPPFPFFFGHIWYIGSCTSDLSSAAK